MENTCYFLPGALFPLNISSSRDCQPLCSQNAAAKKTGGIYPKILKNGGRMGEECSSLTALCYALLKT